ncbi:MAG: alpha/beta hydrolase-fold protein, partial [Gemmataceae bacterium]
LDYLVPFIEKNYSIAPGRENRIIGGVSMGGGSAARIALKYPHQFATCLGIFPPLNIRYENTRGTYLGKYVPGYWQFREDFSRGLEPMGKFFGGLVTIRLKQMLDPLYDRRDPDLAAKLGAENPTELVSKHDNAKYPLSFYIASAGKDEFNIDSQVDTFLDAAEGTGVSITVDYSPRGRHSVRTAARMAPASIRWLGQVLGSQKGQAELGNNLESSK